MVENGGISSYSYKTIVRISPLSTIPLNGSPAMTHSSPCRFLLRWSWRGERRLNCFLRWNLGLALQGKQPFVTFSYLTPLFAPLKGSSSPLSSSFQAASRGVLGQTKKYFFGAALWPCIEAQKRQQPNKFNPQLSLLHSH